MSARLLDAVARLGHELPDPLIADIAARLDALVGEIRPDALDRIAARASKLGARERVREVLDLWRREHPEVPATALAWALRAAAASDAWHRARQRLALIWTGPRQPGTGVRRIDQALLELARQARESLILVSFATYRVADLHAALEERVAAGVSLTFIVESPGASEGRVSSDPLLAIGEDLARQATVLVWPLERRPVDGRGRRGLLHAKCAIADERRLLVSSANLSEPAMSSNMELGLLIDGGDLPGMVARHFAWLASNGVLEPVAWPG